VIRDLTVSDDAAVQAGVPAGSIFGTVQVKAETGFLGLVKSVKFTVDVNNSVLVPDANYGIQKFGFDFDPSVTGLIIIPTCRLAGRFAINSGLGGAGKFEIVGVGSACHANGPPELHRR